MNKHMLLHYQTWLQQAVRRAFRVIKRHRWESALFIALITISLAAHAWNMFGFPYYENDEATYTARAWSFITTGDLDVYTYRYDHAPVGWMFLGVWQLFAGGGHLFGSLMASGRIFMLALHLGSTVLLYILAKRLSGGSKLAGAVAVLFFALSPIALYFQRRILLDNIMTFWVLLSLFYATQPVKRLKNYILSGLTFGLAVLTKLNAIFLAPAILFIVWIRSHRDHRMHASAYWLTVTGMVIMSFFLFAFLKGELLPAPLDANGDPTHVSMVETFQLQLSRGTFAWPWEADSSFRTNVESWARKDWAVLSIGAAATLALIPIAVWRRKKQPDILAVVGLILLYVAFLARGKLVLDLYIVPLIPLLALAIGLIVSFMYRVLPQWRWLKLAFITLLVGSLTLLFWKLPHKQYFSNETANQHAAVDWVRENLPSDAIIATDNYIYPYLAQERGFESVSYFFSAEYDPELRKIYDDDWRNIEYLILTHEVVEQIKTGTVPRMKNILDHAELIADYRDGTSSYIDLPNYISTNGDWVQVYRTKSRNDIVLQDSWQYFKGEFIVDYGQVVNPTNNYATTSSTQAQAMVRAVSEDDQAMFDGLWQWSKDHLRYRTDDKLLSWFWEKQPNGDYTLGDSNNVCDADQQLAYALYKAGERWPGNKYQKEAKKHLEDWWRQCTFTQNGNRFIDSSADGSQDIRLINTSYFRPAYYHYFSEKLPDRNWKKLVGDGFALLERIHAHYKTIPDWTILGTDGSLQSAKPFIGEQADQFSYDALQLIPSLIEHYDAAEDARSLRLFKQLQEPIQAFAARTESPPAQNAQLLLLQTISGQDDKKSVQKLYEKVIYRHYEPSEGFWDDGENYRDQIWFWQWHAAQHNLPSERQVLLQ